MSDDRQSNEIFFSDLSCKLGVCLLVLQWCMFPGVELDTWRIEHWSWSYIASAGSGSVKRQTKKLSVELGVADAVRVTTYVAINLKYPKKT